MRVARTYDDVGDDDYVNAKDEHDDDDNYDNYGDDDIDDNNDDFPVQPHRSNQS